LLVTPGAYPRRKHQKGSSIGFALALPSNSKTLLERVSKGKPSSSLGLVISDEGKKSCITLTPGVNVMKLFNYLLNKLEYLSLAGLSNLV
jgi:hypothetical protein